MFSETVIMNLILSLIEARILRGPNSLDRHNTSVLSDQDLNSGSIMCDSFRPPFCFSLKPVDKTVVKNMSASSFLVKN